MSIAIKLLSRSFKNILITGGSGFIGGALVRYFLENTNCNIFNLDKLTYASNPESINQFIDSNKSIDRNRYKFFKADLNHFSSTKEIILLSEPDIIMHLAAESHVDRSIKNPSSFISNNICGTINLLESATEYWKTLSYEKSSNFLFHYISTDEVFGSLDEEGFFSEVSKYNPMSPYSASKASCDHLVRSWLNTYGLPSIITNCSNNFGKWQIPEKLIPLTIYKCLNHQNIPIYGNGLNVRDWIYIDDHIEALLICVRNAKAGETFCVGGNNQLSNINVVKSICEDLDQKIPWDKSHNSLINYVKDRAGHDFRYAIDNAKISKDLHWKPRYKFKNALSSTIDWYLLNQNWLNESFLRINKF
ncbi:dTDP-glucose 4,6-dehydratase [Prochlorococcus marinus str. MIT 9322]|uniref:dTDP-glucose 4,6-dehydratase n=1 Tax=Prochlorococcus marinus TaxID=1219 RepID=UPI00053382D5|nr:dTDP-glucose 4,6-dehydratase [Prochlorococcus marinus]KGG05499.1 dTDP-glucose 4,6-dehydratase [Prochlorococcus marinus str. MIT 9322]